MAKFTRRRAEIGITNAEFVELEMLTIEIGSIQDRANGQYDMSYWQKRTPIVDAAISAKRNQNRQARDK